jgi:hypothetical protein
MSTHHSRMPTLLILCALTACASTPPQAGRSAPSALPSAPGSASASKAYVTGSRIAVPVDSRTDLPLANPAQQQVSSDDIALTGETDTAAALRRLVPELH